MKHWLAHRLGWNMGHSRVFWHEGVLLVAFVCHGCGQVTDVDRVPYRAVVYG